VQQRICAVLNTPVITLQPIFEQNFAALAAYQSSGRASTSWPREWQKQLGKATLNYFEKFADKLESLGFGKDDMLQEGFKDAVERNEVGLCVVEKVVNGHYNGCCFEGGVCKMQTTPEFWTANVRDTAAEIANLL